MSIILTYIPTTLIFLIGLFFMVKHYRIEGSEDHYKGFFFIFLTFSALIHLFFTVMDHIYIKPAIYAMSWFGSLFSLLMVVLKTFYMDERLIKTQRRVLLKLPILGLLIGFSLYSSDLSRFGPVVGTVVFVLILFLLGLKEKKLAKLFPLLLIFSFGQPNIYMNILGSFGVVYAIYYLFQLDEVK